MPRWYVTGGGERWPSVTTIVGQLPKDGLQTWASNYVAQYAVDHPGAPYDEIRMAARNYSLERANVGTQVHAAILAGRWPRHLTSYAKNCRRLQRQHQLEAVQQETTVWNRRLRYAGTYDWCGYVDGELALVDVKTSKGVYPATRIQLAGYRYSDDLRDWPIQKCYVLHLREDGADLLEQQVGPKEFQVFKHLREVYRWTKSG